MKFAFKPKNLVLLAIIPLLTFAFTDFEADAAKGKGVPSSQYGSATKGIVCGDRLCSESPSVEAPETEEEMIVDEEIMVEQPTEEFEIEPIPTEFKHASSYLVRIYGGEFAETLTFKTFSRVDLGHTPNYIISFYDLELNTYFALESLPSKDKSEFYKLVADYLNPGKPPELFDASIDVLAEDGSIIVTANYKRCEITGYTPYTQEFILFYQYTGEMKEEIRDQATIYCVGINVEASDAEEKKYPENGSVGSESIVPSSEDRAQSYVVHFFGPDFEGLYTLDTFSKFAPSQNLIETPYDTITFPGNPMDTKPQFILESIPSKDKETLYKVFAKDINPGPEPELFNVSIDLVTGDGTILQRWNYIDCELFDYNIQLDDNALKFPFSGQQGPEIRDKSDITCIGINLDVPRDGELDKQPIMDIKSMKPQEETDTSLIYDANNRAQSFIVTVFGGELEDAYTSDKFQKVETIIRDRGPLTPMHHDKQYSFGFLVESLPSQEKSDMYEFLSRYVNPGKAPEPFDVNIDTVTGDGTTLHTIKYTNCEAVDFSWYLQDYNFIYQFSQQQQQEIREKYIFYCTGIRLNFPE